MASFSNSPAVLAFGATALISVLPTIILPFIPLDKGSINSSLHRVMLAFAAGGMLGDVFLHLLPHVMGGHHHHDHNEEGHASVLRQLEAEHAQRDPSAHHHHHTHHHGAHARREDTAHSHEHSHGHSHSHSHQEQEGGGHDSHDHSHHHTHPGEAAAAAAAAAPPPSHDHHGHHHSHSGGGGGGSGGGHGGHGGGHGLADLRVGLAVLAGVLVFFLADKWLRAWHGGDGHSHSHGHAHAPTRAAAGDDVEKEEEKEKASGPGGRALAAAAGPSNGGGSGTGLRRRRGAGAGQAGNDADVVQEQEGNDADDKHKKMKSSGVLSKLGSGGWLNLGADALHNATDGLALGAAFAAAANGGAGAGLGVSTLIATLAHELPHEIGDYAVLVQNGLTKKQAILAQFCTAIGAFMGTAAGLVLHSFEDLQPALLAFTAGGFVYVSCVTVLPEVLNNSGHHHGGGKGDGGVNLKMITQTMAETLGMLIGIGLMVVVALYE